MGVFEMVVLIVGLVTLGEIASKWLDARRPQAEIPASTEGAGREEVERLREQVEMLSGEVDRLSEEQRFMTRLLESGARTRDRSTGESRAETRPGMRQREPT